MPLRLSTSVLLTASLHASRVFALPSEPAPSVAGSSSAATPSGAASQPSATETPQPSAPNIQAPRALSPLQADYPEGAEGEANVVLELLIDRSGNVAEVQLVSGSAPFSERALSAAKAWTFSPALRGGEAVPARIRVEIRFSPPIVEAPEEPAAAPAVTAPNPDAPAEPAPAVVSVEVLVVGDRPADVKTLGRADVRQIPGAFGDPFRAIEVLPGVSPIASGLPYFFVRGAPPGNVGYFFDGISVPLLYHAALGPGVIHPAFIESVNLYTGAYPAQYGRYAGGIVEGRAADPATEFRGEANVRILDAGLFLAAPFASGAGSAMVAGRYSYTGLIASLLAPAGTELGYWDYQARVGYQLDPKSRVSVFGFGSHDFFRAKTDDGDPVTLLDLTFHRLNAKYQRLLGTSSTLQVDVTGGLDRTGSGSQNSDEEAPLDIRGRSLGVRVELLHPVASNLRLRVGADSTWSRSQIAINPDAGDGDEPPDTGMLPGVPSKQLLPPLGLPSGVLDLAREQRRNAGEDAALALLYTRNDWVAGAWVEALWSPSAGVTLTPGLRFDSYKTGDTYAAAVDPRLTARFDITPRWALIHTLGLAHQPPSFVVPIPGLTPAVNGGLQTAIQSSAGAEVTLPAKLFASVTAFQNVTLNATDALSTVRFGAATNEGGGFVSRTTAHAYGFEVYLRRSLAERLGGFASYTWSRSLRTIPRASGLSSFDRTHVINFGLAYELGAGFRLGARLTAYSGIPAAVAYIAALADPPRNPWYYRIDWRLEKRWVLTDGGAWLAVVAELLNTTLNKETLNTSCYAYGCKSSSIGPVTLPSLGLEAAF